MYSRVSPKGCFATTCYLLSTLCFRGVYLEVNCAGCSGSWIGCFVADLSVPTVGDEQDVHPSWPPLLLPPPEDFEELLGEVSRASSNGEGYHLSVAAHQVARVVKITHLYVTNTILVPTCGVPMGLTNERADIVDDQQLGGRHKQWI
eukprot:400219-Amphidinium_carterae.1